jgi:hypothetical protein
MAKTFAEAFRETERLSQHPPLRSLALLVDGAEWKRLDLEALYYIFHSFLSIPHVYPAERIVKYALSHPDEIPEPAYRDLLCRLLYIQEIGRPNYPASYTCN